MQTNLLVLGTAIVCGIALIAGAVLYAQPDAEPAQATEQQPATRAMNPSQFAGALAAPERMLIDIRTPEEFAEGHLKGATNIDFYQEDFPARIAALDRDAPYAIYCRSGNRTGQTAALMRSLGFTDVVELEHGILAWEAEGRATCTDSVC